MQRHRVRLASLVVGVLAVQLLAGCVMEEAPFTGPVSLLQAYRAALDDVRQTDDKAHLIGFLGQEGPPPAFFDRLSNDPYLGQLIGNNVRQVDTSGDPHAGDGRALLWVLLFATRDGHLVRATVTADPLTVTVDTDGRQEPQLVALWSLNLGGRLLVDSTEAAATARAADPTFDGRITSGGRVTYASDLVTVGDPGDRDLAHAVFVDSADGDLLVAHIGHYTGELLGVGPYTARRDAQRTVLVDESFTLDPVTRNATARRDAPFAVADARLLLETEGAGRFTFAIRDADRTLWSTEGLRTTERVSERAELGTLAPGTYTIEASAIGNVRFHLKVDGVLTL